MLVYLDTKDLIALLSGSKSYSAEDFEAKLRAGGHKLILSSCTVLELAAPLRLSLGKTNVMTRLNRLERMPVDFINDDLPRLELAEALNAFAEGREYRDVYFFVKRLDEHSYPGDIPFTRHLLNIGLAESVFELWAREPGMFLAYRPWAPRFNEALAVERASVNLPSLEVQFVNKIRKSLISERLPEPQGGVTAFAKWIRSVPSRCPSEQLRFDTFNQLRSNTLHVPPASITADFVHLLSLPYVDLITLDSTMQSYVRQACRSLNMNCETRILRNVDAVVAALDEIAAEQAGSE
jgi:hypothetical protein